jgi:hypothetical protein
LHSSRSFSNTFTVLGGGGGGILIYEREKVSAEQLSSHSLQHSTTKWRLAAEIAYQDVGVLSGESSKKKNGMWTSCLVKVWGVR